MPRRWLPLILCCTAALALPFHAVEETDSEESRKVLGSSVVTSVSVIMDLGNGTKQYYADAAGRPVPKPTAASLVGSPAQLMNPDRYEFYTFDEAGDLVKRLMTLDEIQSIIANGETDIGEPGRPNYYHQSLPSGPAPVAAAVATDMGELSSSVPGVQDVVMTVQNLLKEQMEKNKPLLVEQAASETKISTTAAAAPSTTTTTTASKSTTTTAPTESSTTTTAPTKSTTTTAPTKSSTTTTAPTKSTTTTAPTKSSTTTTAPTKSTTTTTAPTKSTTTSTASSKSTTTTSPSKSTTTTTAPTTTTTKTTPPAITTTKSASTTIKTTTTTTKATPTTTSSTTPPSSTSTTTKKVTSTPPYSSKPQRDPISAASSSEVSAISSEQTESSAIPSSTTVSTSSITQPSKTESTMADNGALKTNKPMDKTSSPSSPTTEITTTTKRTTTKAPTPTTTKRTATTTTTTTTTSSPAITTAGTKLSTWTSVESEPAASSDVSSVNKMPAKPPAPTTTTTTTKPTSTRPVINRDPLEPTMVMISSSESIESEDIAAAQEFLNIFSQPNLQKITTSYTRRPTTDDNKIMVSSSSSATTTKPIRRPPPSTVPTTSPSRKPVRTTTSQPATTTTTTTESPSSASSIEENSMSTMELLKTTSSSTTTTEKAEAENSIINEATVFVPTKIHSPLESMPHTGSGNIAMPPELAESFLGVLSQVADIGGAATTIDYGDNGMMLISSSTTTKRSTTEGIKKITTSRTPTTTEQPTTPPPAKTEPSTSTMKAEQSTTMKTAQPSTAIMRDEEPSNIVMKTEKPKPDQSTVTTMRAEQSTSTTLEAQQPLTTTEAEQSSISTMKEEKQSTTTVAATATREEQPSNIVLKTEKPTTITTTKPEEAAATTARTTEQPMSTTIKAVQPPYAFVKRKQTTTKPERTTEMKTEEPTTTTMNIEEILEEKSELHSTTAVGISETTLRAEANRQDEVTTEFATETTTTETNVAMETSSLTPKPTEKDRSTMAPSLLVEKTKDSDKVGSETKVIEGVGNKVNAPVKADDNKGQEEDSNKKDGIKNKVNLKTSDKEQSDDDLAMSLLVEMSKIYASKNSTTTPESEVSTTERLEERTTTLATDTEATTVNAVQESTTTVQNANTRRNDINAKVDVDKTTAAAESTTKAAEEATESQTSKGPEIPIGFQTKYKKEDQTEDVANVNDLKRLTTEKAETTTLTEETTTVEEVTTNKERERDESMTDLRTVLPPSTTEAVLTTEEVKMSSEDTTSVKPTETTESETEQPTSTTQSPETTSLPQMNKQVDRETALSQTDSVEETTMTEIVKTTSTTATVPSTTEKEKIVPKITKKPSSTTKKTSTTTTEAPTTSAEILKVNVNAEEKFKDTKVKAQPEGPEKQKPLALEPVPKENLGLEASSTGLGEDVRSFSELCNELAFRLWASLTSRGMTTSRSLILSPFAVTSLLAMVFLGARGPTSGQMNDILRLDDMVTFNPHLVFRNVTESVGLSKGQGIATAAFVRELYSDKMRGKLLDFYKDRVQQFYDGHVEEVNFNMIGDLVRRRTNLLIKRQTRGRVPEYLRGNNVMLRPPLAVFSANIFQTDCTRASTYGRDGEMFFTVMPASRSRRLVPVPAVVWFSGFLAGYEPVLDATAASIGAADSLVSLVLVLPGQQAQVAPGDGLPRLEQRLIDTSYRRGAWSRLLRSLAPRPGLELQIPRFSHRSLLNVTAPLQRMGLRDLFSAEHADLRGINGIKNDLHLSDIVQVNTFSTCAEESVGSRHHVEVYPTSAQRSGREDLEEDPRKGPSSMDDLEDFGMSSVPLALRPRQARLPDAPRLKFDRPFLYFVRHNPTGLILHMGRFNPRILH